MQDRRAEERSGSRTTTAGINNGFPSLREGTQGSEDGGLLWTGPGLAINDQVGWFAESWNGRHVNFNDFVGGAFPARVDQDLFTSGSRFILASHTHQEGVHAAGDRGLKTRLVSAHERLTGGKPSKGFLRQRNIFFFYFVTGGYNPIFATKGI